MIYGINVYICNMISINEAADLLGVTAKTLRWGGGLLKKRGKLNPFVRGRLV
jgi:predicted transcriptional regulator of viral defense system